MLPSAPAPAHSPALLFLLLAALAPPTPSASQELQVRGHRTKRAAEQEAVEVLISGGGASHEDPGKDVHLDPGSPRDLAPGSPRVLAPGSPLVLDPGSPRDLAPGSPQVLAPGSPLVLAPGSPRVLAPGSPLVLAPGSPLVLAPGSPLVLAPGSPRVLAPGSPLVLAHHIELVPSGSGSGLCGCESDLAALRQRLERLEREVSTLRGKCGGADGGCCTSKESTGAGCSIKPKHDACPHECSDRGRCVDGRCECVPGFSGPDCSGTACPDDCNSRGRCSNGQCVCDDGFSGGNCSEPTCPSNCSDRGHCVHGKCVCNSGFTGDNCSEDSCPGNCNSRGRCVHGQCVCSGAFTGTDCGERACPNTCSGRGRCVNGKCVCSAGFSGPSCAAQGCLRKCNNKGHCFKGRCVCRRGFRGPDCNTVMSAVSQLRAEDVRDTSVTLLWTLPAVQYDSFHISFSRQKDRDQQISAQVDGRLSSFTQTGLAAGQEYNATITGEVGGRRGAESATRFMTLLSGPTNLHVVKTTSTSAVVQWDKSQGEIDRYRLNIAPTDGGGKTRGITVPVDQDSAHIGQLEAGRPYDIILVAEKDASQSQPATTRVIPGSRPPQVTKAAENQVSGQQGAVEDEPETDSVPVGRIDGRDKDSVAERNEALVSRTVAINGTRPKHDERLTWSRKPQVPDPLRFNTTRGVPGGTKVGRGPLKRPPMGDKQKVVPTKSKPEVPKTRTIDMTVASAEGGADGHPARSSGSESETRRSSSEEPKRKPDVSSLGQEHHTAAGSSQQTSNAPGSSQQTSTAPGSSQQTSTGPGSSQQTSTAPGSSQQTSTAPGSSQQTSTAAGSSQQTSTAPGSSQQTSTAPGSSQQTSTAQSQDKKCLNRVRVTHTRLPQRDQGGGCGGGGTALEGNPGDSDRSTSDDSPDLLQKLLTDTFDSLNITTFSVHLSKPSDVSGDEDTAWTGLKPVSSPSSSSSSTAAPSPSSSSLGSGKPHSEETKDTASPAERNQPRLRLTPPKQGSTRRPRPLFGLFQNRTHLRVPPRPPPRDHMIPRTESETRDMSTTEPLPSSAVEESAPMKMNTLVRDASRDKDGPAAPASSGQKVMLTEGGRVPVRPLPPRGGYVRRPFQNKTRPHVRLMTRPVPPPSPETQRAEVSPAEFPTTSSPPDVKAENMQPIGEDNEDRAGVRTSSTTMSSELSQTLRGRGEPSSHHPTRAQYFRRPHMYAGPLQNRTRPHLRQPQYRRRGLMHKPFPDRTLNGDAVGSQTKQQKKGSTSGWPEIPKNQLGQQGVPRPTQRVQFGMRQTGGQETADVSNLVDGHSGGAAPTQTTTSGEEETVPLVSEKDSDLHNQRVHIGKGLASSARRRQNIQHTFSDPRTVSLPKRQPLSRNPTGHRTQVRGTEREEDPQTNPPVQRVLQSKSGSDVPWSRDTGEHLGYVRVTNRTSGGFTLVWDSPEGKYQNFIVVLKHRPTNEPGQRSTGDRVSQRDKTRLPMKQSSTTVKPATGSEKSFKEVLPGSVRSLHFKDLAPQTEYAVTLLGKGPGLLSRLHQRVVSTGPEPPTHIVFSEVTGDSLTVSWTKPQSPVGGFKVTYSLSEGGEPVSVSLDPQDSSLGLSRLSPGSTYEVSVVSILGLDESDPVHDFVSTLPDPPTHLRAVNITDTQDSLPQRPPMAPIDKSAIASGSGSGSESRITVSGDGLELSTSYTVTRSSQLGPGGGAPAATSFTTSRGSEGAVPRDLHANNVTPRTALLSWKPPVKPAPSYRLTYQAEGREVKEVVLESPVTQLNLTGLHPGSKYSLRLQAGERFTATQFTTGALRFPFPTDCSQELLNGLRTSGEVEIFPQGNQGAPMMVYCDMETDGGGWTVFQRRKDGSVDFFKGWRDYVKGFGDLSGEFWLGLESLHNLTTMTRMSLRVDLRDGRDSAFAKYSTFQVTRGNYTLTVGGYSGDAGDSLSYHSNRVFSTKDRDPSPFITRCAVSYRGGWWYRNCHEANLNGLYGTDDKHQGIIWTSWKGKDTSVPFTEMKMRPASFSPAARDAS